MKHTLLHTLICVTVCNVSHYIVHTYLHSLLAVIGGHQHYNVTSDFASLLRMSLIMFCISTPICITIQTPIMLTLNKHSYSWFKTLTMSATMSCITMLTMMITEFGLKLFFDSESIYIIFALPNVAAFTVTFYYNYNHSSISTKHC